MNEIVLYLLPFFFFSFSFLAYLYDLKGKDKLGGF